MAYIRDEQATKCASTIAVPQLIHSAGEKLSAFSPDDSGINYQADHDQYLIYKKLLYKIRLLLLEVLRIIEYDRHRAK